MTVALLRFLGICGFLAVLLTPAWWLAGRLQGERGPFVRLLIAGGFALLGYLTFLNLIGRVLGNSITAATVWLSLNVVAIPLLWRWRADGFGVVSLGKTWRSWAGPLLLAIALGLPQWLLAVSTNYWDEAASSAIHLSAPSQFAEGLFPPRHNAFPDLPIKYHYGFTILSGTVKWVSGLSANISIDIASTSLWLFIFLFAYFWLRELSFGRFAATWGGFSLLLGGGLSWLYLPRLEAYSGVAKIPPASDLLHRFDPARGWLANLLGAAKVPSLHLRNADGSLSNLPWDIAAQFQQHAVSLGIALTLVALYLLVTWMEREGFAPWLLAANVAAFSVLPLGHAVFGAVAIVTAGVCLLWSWLRRPTRVRFLNGAVFAAATPVLALLHGGMLARGAEYGGGGFNTFRKALGYASGGLEGFLHWNVAGFGAPLLLAIAAWILHRRRRDPKAIERNVLFFALTVFGAISYLVPQVMFYSSETSGVEQFTEISKFFFCAHFAFALLSAYGVEYLARGRWARGLLVAFPAAAVIPLAFCYANSVDAKRSWLGFYRAPYHANSIEEQMGRAMGRLKTSNRDVYFDSSADERRHHYISEMFVFGGSVFTMTPSRFERTGVGFRIAEDVVARRYVQNGRLARLLPGAAEQAGCDWYYSRPVVDATFAPLVVRSRFNKLVADGSFAMKFSAGQRALYAIEKPTADLDRDIERHWDPRIVSQTTPDWDGDGKGDLIFYDYVDKRILVGGTSVALPEVARGEFVNLYVGRFPGEPRADLLVGRMKDTRFDLGRSINETFEQSRWGWSYRDSFGGVWQPEYEHWQWDYDIPFIADLDNDGRDSLLGFRPRTGEWFLARDKTLPGPKVEAKLLPLPLGGRFLEGSRGDLGLWSLGAGTVTLQSLSNGKTVSFRWGGRPGDVLVPGDYDGDGYDEIAVWQRTNRTWYWRRAPDGPVAQATFGSETGLPVPADYDGDGRLDLAYWEPGEGRIYISFSLGRSVDRTVTVPPHSIPAYVNML